MTDIADIADMDQLPLLKYYMTNQQWLDLTSGERTQGAWPPRQPCFSIPPRYPLAGRIAATSRQGRDQGAAEPPAAAGGRVTRPLVSPAVFVPGSALHPALFRPVNAGAAGRSCVPRLTGLTSAELGRLAGWALRCCAHTDMILWPATPCRPDG